MIADKQRFDLRCHLRSMLNKDYTAKLIDLEDVIVTKVENFSEEVHVYLELPRIKHRCPACGALTDHVHAYRMQIIKDVPLGRTTLLHLRKRRYCCDCGKRFFEKITFLPRYYRSTSRLIVRIINAFREMVSAAKIGSQFNVSGTTAMRYFKPCTSSSSLTTLGSAFSPSAKRNKVEVFFGRNDRLCM